MPTGLNNLKHIVVLMMSCRSFDHMLGSLMQKYPKINGLTGNESNPDTKGTIVKVQQKAEFQSQLDPDPDHHFPGVDLQIFGGQPPGPGRVANMQGFVKDYFSRTKDVSRSHNIMYYFDSAKDLPVLSTLATEFAVFNGWFSSIPGPTICNRAFAHYGTSFGQVGLDIFYILDKGVMSIYERMIQAGHTAKIYYYDQPSSTMEIANLLKNQPKIFAALDQFITDCAGNTLPEYSFIEPCHNDHPGVDGGQVLASDQHPDHNVREGERFIANVYNAIRTNPTVWQNTALLVVYDEHGGIYDHVVPPACTPDGYNASADATGTGAPFAFDRLGIRVPAVLVSPWIPRGTVMPGTEDPANSQIFDHASIPGTVTNFFLNGDAERTVREQQAKSFLGLLGDQMRGDNDCVVFNLTGGSGFSATRTRTGTGSGTEKKAAAPTKGKRNKETKTSEPGSTIKRGHREISAQTPTKEDETEPALLEVQVGPSTHVARDRWTTNDSLGHFPYAYAIYRFLTDGETRPPLAISIQAPWGGGKTSLMRMIQAQLDPEAVKKAEHADSGIPCDSRSATVKQVLNEFRGGTTKRGPAGKQSSALPSSAHDTAEEKSGGKQRTPKVPVIEGGGERRVTVWFNAWKYESTSQVWAGLADCIVQQVGERLGPVERELFWFKLQMKRLDAAEVRRKVYEEAFSQFVGRLIPMLWAYLTGPSVSLLLALVGHLRNSRALQGLGWTGVLAFCCIDLIAASKQLKSAKDEVEENPARLTFGGLVRAPDYNANLGFVHEVVEDLRRVFELIPRQHLPMVVFIDDLDRCSPGKVAAVVEAINLFLAGEFPDCMFVLGIDDEMVAAALDQAHRDVIAKLPGYARSTSIGWRFMDKFVQLPFIVPPSSGGEINRYVDSLLSQGSQSSTVDVELRDRAARVVERSANQTITPEEIMDQVTDQRPLAATEHAALKKEVEIIQEMDQNIRKFSDKEQIMRDLVASRAKAYFENPRDVKRFVNLFRFYYFLRAAREARGEPVSSLEQMCRWIVLSLRWPEVVRWMRRQATMQNAEPNSSLVSLESLGASCQTFSGWQASAQVKLGMLIDQTPWLSDEGLMKFFQDEAAKFAKEARLSACAGLGLW